MPMTIAELVAHLQTSYPADWTIDVVFRSPYYGTDPLERSDLDRVFAPHPSQRRIIINGFE